MAILEFDYNFRHVRQFCRSSSILRGGHAGQRLSLDYVTWGGLTFDFIVA